MGTIIEGDLPQVLDLMRECIEEVAKSSNRVTCTAKIDYRQGVSGGIQSKVASVRAKLGQSAASN